MASKNYTTARNSNRLSYHLEHDKFGEKTAYEAYNNIPIKKTVGSALNELNIKSEHKIGEYVFLSEKNDPSGNPQTDKITVEVANGEIENTQNILFFGESIEINKNDTEESIITKLIKSIENRIEENLIFKEVERDENDNSSLIVSYKDSNEYNFDEYWNGKDVKYTFEKLNDPIKGYGTWVYFGVMKNKTDANEFETHVYKRVS